jgi:hypothetical protein
VDAFAWGSIVVGGPLDVASEFERRLAVGAGIACRLRGALLRELGAVLLPGAAAAACCCLGSGCRCIHSCCHRSVRLLRSRAWHP